MKSRLIAAAVASWAAVYLTFAFMCWDINAANWTEGARLLCGMMATCACGLAAAMILEATHD